MITKVKPFLQSVYVVDGDVCRAAGRDENDGVEAHYGEGGGAIADTPSSTVRSMEKVGKKGRTSVKEATKWRGRA